MFKLMVQILFVSFLTGCGMFGNSASMESDEELIRKNGIRKQETYSQVSGHEYLSKTTTFFSSGKTASVINFVKHGGASIVSYELYFYENGTKKKEVNYLRYATMGNSRGAIIVNNRTIEVDTKMETRYYSPKGRMDSTLILYDGKYPSIERFSWLDDYQCIQTQFDYTGALVGRYKKVYNDFNVLIKETDLQTQKVDFEQVIKYDIHDEEIYRWSTISGYGVAESRYEIDYVDSQKSVVKLLRKSPQTANQFELYSTHRYEYDNNKRLIKETSQYSDESGSSTLYVYKRNKLKEKVEIDNQTNTRQSVEYSYNKMGLLAQVNDGISVVRYEYY